MKEGKGYGRGGIRERYPGGTLCVCYLKKKKNYWSIVDLKCCVFSTVQQSGSAIHIHPLFLDYFPI